MGLLTLPSLSPRHCILPNRQAFTNGDRNIDPFRIHSHWQLGSWCYQIYGIVRQLYLMVRDQALQETREDPVKVLIQGVSLVLRYFVHLYPLCLVYDQCE